MTPVPTVAAIHFTLHSWPWMVRKERLHVRSNGKNRVQALKIWLFAAPITTLVLYGIIVRLISIHSCLDKQTPFATVATVPSVTYEQVIPTLSSLTESVNGANCTGRQIWISNVNGRVRSTTPKIPHIVHQTSKSRCVTQNVATAIRQWSTLDGCMYVFHDDAAVMRLLLHEFPEFPHLNHIVRHCVLHGTIKADLWRYLVLWVYGGIYADIDAAPVKFTLELLDTTDDALFVVEQYHLLSQWFMAVSPRHPLMYYAIQQCLSNLLVAMDTGSVSAAMVTGPHALHRAYLQFRLDGGTIVDSAAPGHKPVWAGHFVGSYNRSVTVVGQAERQNEYVHRDVLGAGKKRDYAKMGMRHFQDDKKHASGVSCTRSMLNAYYSQTTTP